MASRNQVPGGLDIICMTGDELQIPITFNIDLTGFTFESKVKVNIATIDLTVENVDLSTGKIKLSLQEIQTHGIPEGNYSWYFRWTTNGIARTILAGNFKAVKYE